MYSKRLVKLSFKVTPEDKETIERAMSTVRGNFGSEASLDAERGQALIMMAKMILSEYMP